MDTLAYRQNLRKLAIASDVALTLARFMREEKRRGTLWTNLKGLPKAVINQEMSWAEMLEERAVQVPDKHFLLYNNEKITYSQMDINANRAANLLHKLGGGRGKGLGIFVKNSPRYLDCFFGAQKIGMYIVPLNAELKGDGLRYVIDHSDIEYLVLDAELLEPFLAIKDSLPKLKGIIINDCEPEGQGIAIPDGLTRLSEAASLSNANPGIGYNPEDICLIMYTSGTTGRAKGVVYRYSCTNVKKLGLLAGVFIKKDDIYYTPLPLFHANAMFLTITFSLACKATVALSRKFSASRFWDEIRLHNATVFNAIGSMVPILMKQPPKPTDSQNQVRYVLSAACPADMWEDFEKRFGLTVYEGYGAVDGGGKVIMNIGTAPVGSIGKPSKGVGKYRIVDDQGRDVPAGVPGELIFKVGSSKGSLEYYKNETATNDKLKDGWLYTGDLIRTDEQGYLYFVGRNTESMRKGGENVSAYEVEHVIMDHPAVEEVAVYAVPSELAEDEIMASVKLVEGIQLTPAELIAFLKDKLARFAIPRYVRIVDEFPMTSTHRIMKKELEKLGVTPDTYDSQKA
ncbi:MAG: AMP-binding protein [Syntrophaceae bacterium]